jgi:hypothetical protein
MPSRCVNMEDALRDPAGAFAAPEDVVADAALTREQKIRILKLWKQDTVAAEVAMDEGMPGKNEALLRPILVALRHVAAGTDVNRAGAAKQHTLL